MSRINLDSPKITICLTAKAKTKAARIAKARGLSVTQLIEELISGAATRPPAKVRENIRAIIREELAAQMRRQSD